MQPNEPTDLNDEERAEQLPEDGATPFQPADPNPASTGNTTDPIVAGGGTSLPDDHPATDDKLDETEVYDEGLDGAAEVSDQSDQSAVTGLIDEDENEDLTQETL